MIFTNICRGCVAHAANESCAQVREDVAEDILGHHDIEFPWSVDQMHGHGIYIGVICLQFAVFLCRLVKNIAKERERWKHVRLVDAGDTPLGAASLSGFGQFKYGGK